LALKTNKIFLFILKISISSVLLYVVLSKTGLGSVLSILRNINPFYFITAVFLYILSQFISTLRWKLLLPHTFGIRNLFSLYMIGAFFNTLLPGIVGGDAVKGFYLYQATGKGSLIFASIFMERYLGFVVLITICVIAYPFGYHYLRGSQVEWLLPFVVISFIFASLLVFGLRLGKRIKLLSDFYEYFHAYRNQKDMIRKALFLSVLIQVLGISSVYVLATGIGQHIPFLACLIFVPLIVIFTMIPISISGLGVREGSFVLFFGFIGVKPEFAAAISFSWFIAMVMGNLVGLMEYLKYKKEGFKL
jgi:glycosyltransferase 2 family protein